mmetsp:Transcript_16823/g.39461  ORF Transcript_16823/g.39461 Transcript_16823/m.39461 type:complete len:546 (+) Transcript_16823:180-1817(+)
MEVDGGTTRAELKRSCFRGCDRDDDGFLNKAEMMTFAQYAGFNGTPEEWEEEYKKLCAEHSVDVSRGVPSAVMMQLMDDETDQGCFLSDAELREILELGSEVNGQASSGAGSEAHAPEEERMVFFSSAHYSTDEDALQRIFETAGKIQELNLYRALDGRSYGMGLVTYASASDAQRAVNTLHGKVADGRDLVVVPADSVPEIPRHSACKGDKCGKGGKAKGENGGKGQQMRRWWPEEDRLALQRLGRAEAWEHGHEWDGCEYGHDESSYDGNESHNSRDSYSQSSGRTRGGDGRTVFFGGAPFDTTGGYLLSRFRTVGRVQAFWLFTLANGRSRGMGLVQYRAPSEAWAAVETLSGTNIDGRELMVVMDEVGALSSDTQDEYAANWESRSAGKARVGGRYSNHAKEEQNVDKTGLAELPFLQKQNALAAYSPATWGKGSGGSRFSPYGRPRGALTSAHNLRMDPRRSVFFANVPYEIDEEGIKELFEEIGRIRSCVLFRTSDDRSRGMGVVEYMTAASAARAYFHLHGFPVDGRRLVVDEYHGER